jgi:DNA-binding Lrp family transcriptional regulator
MKTALDRIDVEIIRAMQKNARLSNKELAAEVGLAASSTLERVRRLQKADVLRGAHMDVDPRALGIRLQALVAIRMAQHNREASDAFRRYLGELPEVQAIYHVSGVDDFLLHVVARDTEHLRDFVLNSISVRPEVNRYQTSLIFDHERRTVLPLLSEG